MDVTTALLTRRSEHDLTSPAPGHEEFAYLLKVAATAPDHGLLRPWRWILIHGEAREKLGACLAEEAPLDRRSRAAAKTQRAPLLASLVFAPVHGHKVPEWEQLAATSAMTQSLMLLLHARGYGSIWRTGPGVGSPPGAAVAHAEGRRGRSGMAVHRNGERRRDQASATAERCVGPAQLALARRQVRAGRERPRHVMVEWT
ncbi:nitroreductase family protein [Streptomyces hydrogenans]|uniref:nitroreductase family protein n=1 Tax=Streptomyces hydrogenans TaxID=1873719 RepID=UPI003804000C